MIGARRMTAAAPENAPMPNTSARQDRRLFVAAAIRTHPALDAVRARLNALGRAVRPVAASQLHLTLKFYGNVADEVIPELAERLDAVTADRKPFDWRLRGTGAFPTPQRPSVVWAAAEDAGRFTDLAHAIEQFSIAFGFPRERRPFTAHVTLARIKFRPPPELAELLQETRTHDFGPQRSEALILMQSERGPRGSIYTPLHTARFLKT